MIEKLTIDLWVDFEAEPFPKRKGRKQLGNWATGPDMEMAHLGTGICSRSAPKFIGQCSALVISSFV